MRSCCPAGRGCNAVDRDELCALVLVRAFLVDESAAALALERWEVFVDACERRAGGDGVQRFRRRAYERIRDRALVAITMRSASWLIDRRVDGAVEPLAGFDRAEIFPSSERADPDRGRSATEQAGLPPPLRCDAPVAIKPTRKPTIPPPAAAG